LNVAGIPERLLDNDECLAVPDCDYEKVNEKINIMREQSVDFLLGSLESFEKEMSGEERE